MSNEKTTDIRISSQNVPGMGLVPIFANKANVTINPLTTRLAFGEFVTGNQDKDINFHTVVVIPTLEVVGMAHLILSLVDGNPTIKLALASLEELGRNLTQQK